MNNSFDWLQATTAVCWQDSTSDVRLHSTFYRSVHNCVVRLVSALLYSANGHGSSTIERRAFSLYYLCAQVQFRNQVSTSEPPNPKHMRIRQAIVGLSRFCIAYARALTVQLLNDDSESEFVYSDSET